VILLLVPPSDTSLSSSPAFLSIRHM
jgi:hypothetical protein